jgi:CBS-domain-containing membrane protein
MLERSVKRLPVVDGQGRLCGIVSRLDLMRAFVRADAAIEDEIGRLPEGPGITCVVGDGIVHLTGACDEPNDIDALARSIGNGGRGPVSCMAT